MKPKPQAYRPNKPPTVSASVHMWADCADAVKRYAASHKPPLTTSGAIHKLLRTHPTLDLEDFS